MKRLILIFLTLAMLLGQSMILVCFASEQEDIATPSDTPNQMEEIQPEEPREPNKPIKPPPDWESTGGTIVEMESSAYPEFVIDNIPYGETDFATLRENLMYTGLDCIWQRGEEQYSLTLPIDWNYDNADPFLSGEIQTLSGKAILPEGTSVATDVDISTSIQFKVDAATIELVSFQQQQVIPALALPLNQPDELVNCFADMRLGVTAYDKDGKAYKLWAENWDVSKVDMSQTGVYSVTTLPTIEAGYVVAEGVELPVTQHLVSVQTPGKPDINTCFLARGIFRFPWILSDEQAAQTEQFSAWLRVEGEEWTQLSEDDYGISYEEFYLSVGTLISKKSYEMQIDYPGGQTGILSFYYDESLLILSYSQGDRDGNDNDDDTIDPPLIQPPLAPPETLPPPDNGGDSGNDSGGDDDSDNPSEPTPPSDDGGKSDIPSEAMPYVKPQTMASLPMTLPNGVDSGESDTPPKPTSPIAPLPVPPLPVISPSNKVTGENSATAEPTPSTPPSPSNIGNSISTMKRTDKDNQQGYERVDGDLMEISGARLAWLLERNAQFVPFGWNEVSIEVPVTFLETLSLTPNDMLSVTLARESDLSFTLMLSAKGEMVTELESTLVRLPLPKPQHRYTLSLAGNRLETPVAYENGCAVFSITQTGTYEVIDEPIPLSNAPQSEPPKETKVPPIPLEPTANDFLPMAVTGTVLLLGGGFWLWRRR